MAASIYVEVIIDPHVCGVCGVTFGMDRLFIEDRLTDGKTWYCPNGHPRCFADSTKAQLEQARRNLAWSREALASERAGHRRTSNRLAGTQGALTRTKRRANAGVCLNCHRTFANVVRHRERMHPEGKAAE